MSGDDAEKDFGFWDSVSGDKVGGDKIGRDKNVYNIGASSIIHPNPTLKSIRVTKLDRKVNLLLGMNFNFDLEYEIENESQMWLEKTTMGLLHYSIGPSEGRISASLLQNIDLKLPNVGSFSLLNLKHSLLIPKNVEFEPYANKSFRTQHRIPYQTIFTDLIGKPKYLEWKAVCYLGAKDASIDWYQILMSFSKESFGGGSVVLKEDEVLKKILKWKRCNSERPTVGYYLKYDD